MTNEEIGLYVGNAMAHVSEAKATMEHSSSMEDLLYNKTIKEMNLALSELGKIYEEYVKFDPKK